MPSNKNYSIREQVLDHYLGSGIYYSGEELIKACNCELERRGMEPIKSRTTLQKDLTEIENKNNVVISRKQRGRQTLYRYQDKSFSIYKVELSGEEYEKLKSAMNVLSRFAGLPQFSWVSELEAHFNCSFTNQKQNVVSFETGQFNRGMEHFTPLFDAITKKHVLRLTYQKFDAKSPLERMVHPYHLKQYNRRWFLFCMDDQYGNISNYPLDRIVSLERTTKSYKECEIDFEEYFEDVIGVTRPTGTESQKIQLWISRSLWDYIDTKPIHGSQTRISEDESGVIIEIDVIPNYELEQLLLSYGEGINVLSPKELREKIKGRIEESMKKY